MNKEIHPKYEVLFYDLKNHLIGDYLVSRDFKLMMSENDLYEIWKKTYENVKRSRTYFAIGFDHERGDNIDTLLAFLNHIEQNKKVEDIITLIIKHFIEYKKTNEDFYDVIQAMKISGFKEESISKIEAAFKKHKSLNLPKKEITQKNEKRNTNSKDKKDVFIVHGHNEEIKEKVARTLEKLKLNPIILNEQSNEGQTIIEKIEKYSNVGFAIVLLTYDDFGNVKSNNIKNKRARQNVILELGYFLAKIGRKNVMPLYENGVELPSDISGVLYTIIDETENWKLRLIKELKTAGFKINANDIL